MALSSLMLGSKAQAIPTRLWFTFATTQIGAFRHYDCNDQWSIYIDNIAVEIPGAVEPAEWTLVEGAKVDAEDYTIYGLMPDTKYEAQVMAIGPDGRTTDWTESVLFTTVAEDPSAISTVGVDAKADNAYYNLLGVKFNSMPTTPGIYIHNGKKVVIK